MIELLILTVIVLIILGALLWRMSVNASNAAAAADAAHAVALRDCRTDAHASMVALLASHSAERESWRAERRFLIDRVVAKHAGEAVYLEREDTRKHAETDPYPEPERQPRPLIEGLS